MSLVVSSTAPAAPSVSSHPARPGPHAPPSPMPVRQCARRAAVPWHPRRDAQRVGLQACLARRPPRRAQPELAATPLARPYDLRHAALSLWLNATGEPAEAAARAGNSPRVLYEVYLHCTDGQDDAVSQRIEDALDAGTGTTPSQPHVKGSGYKHRRHRLRPRPLYVHEPVPGPPTAHERALHATTAKARPHRLNLESPQVRAQDSALFTIAGSSRTWPTHSPRTEPTVSVTAHSDTKSR